ncbi:MAG: efflux RND transporter permease subunit [Deltaproteobacteria bacterium]|nr:efflux RND transporter permease subunit [Deltaproteobacteria bacterium]MBN2673331.1 efflux RND transporter permease subunit [Deltaproteobacteria bacterium]
MVKDVANNLKKGAIGWMAHNSVAANLLMVVIILGGIIGVVKSKQEVFPEFSLDTIQVQVPYPGASPEETEQGIVLAIEEAVRGLDGVKRVTSTAAEGSGMVTVELLSGENPDAVLADVKNAVDRITSFPEEAERPLVKLLAPKARVISLVIAADRDLKELHEVAEMARNDLLGYPEITQVEIEGVPSLEVSIEIPQETLESYGLTLEQVAAAVKAASVELPGGSVKTSAGEVLVRVTDRKRSGHEFEDVILRSSLSGSKVRLGDIAKIRDGFVETDMASFFNGKRAVRVTAYRVGDETPTEISDVVHKYKEVVQKKLPDGFELVLWQDDSELLTGRIELLNKNAAYGGALVVLLLALILRLRLALWVSVGIPISFFGAFFLMPGFDASINMITLFAFIVTLGMVVDDAIVVGENIFHKMQQGVPKLQAAVEGAREMAMPITFSILTTMVTFAPMLFVPGIMGKIFYLIPLVVILVLGFSLFESFFILPAHLAHSTGKDGEKRTGFFSRMQAHISDGLDWFIQNAYRRLLERTVKYRFVTVAIGISVLLVSVGLVAGGFVPFKFFPQLEGDLVTVTAELPYGTPVAETIKVQKILEECAYEAIDKHGGKKILRGMFTNLGSGATVSRGPHAGSGGSGGSHLVTIELNLVPSDDRSVGSERIRADWEALLPQMAGLKSLTFKSQAGPSAGAAVDVKLISDDVTVLQTASNTLADELRGFSELVDIETSYSEGKKQVDYKLLPKARSLGLTSFEIARQIRSAFYGTEALREQRGRNELKVMVRYPESERRSEFNIENMLIRTAEGGQVPLEYVAQANRNMAPTSIQREDGKRVVNVSAELAAGVSTPDKVLKSLTNEILPELLKQYPGLTYEMAGEQREQKEAFAALGANFLIALAVMFALIAIPFRSYVQPLIIMVAIPFGFVGAIFGHLVMGYNLSFISILGIVALAGVVVNDSLVLIDAANNKRREGDTALGAILYGGTRRFRPILLTSLTTFLGLAPMIAESSLQARFLIPMAISLGFGVLFSTVITLLLVPALYMLIDDISRNIKRFVHWVNS